MRKSLIPISVVMVTKDEEKNIEDAIESVKDFSEIIIIDSHSSDRTVDICKRYTEKVFQEEWKGYARQKQKGIDLASLPWVLILDADERLTPELKSEIANSLHDNRSSGFYIPRKNFFLGKWIRHGGWWPDYTLRFFRKDRAYIEEREVHEKVVVKGKTGYLKNSMEHHTSRTLSDFLRKLVDYSTLSAKEINRKGLKPNMVSLTVRPLLTFSKMFFLRLGFLDGKHGLILSVLYSYYTFLKYAKAWVNDKTKGRLICT
jgi:glycosyltransferase involved in cell wall biosynthesis